MKKPSSKKPKKSKASVNGYGKKKKDMDRLAKEYIHRAQQESFMTEVRVALAGMPPAICISRKIGVGSLELAKLLGKKLSYRVIDKEIVDYISREAQLTIKSIETFDESYPGRLKEFLCGFLGDKPFQLTDYSEFLFSAFFFLASSHPTIFVGRGAHLVLPREKVFAVRCISSKSFRVKRLAKIQSISEIEAERIVDKADREQKEFYRKVYGKSDAPAEEFDIIINFDHLKNTEAIAGSLASLFAFKFGIRPGR